MEPNPQSWSSPSEGAPEPPVLPGSLGRLAGRCCPGNGGLPAPPSQPTGLAVLTGGGRGGGRAAHIKDRANAWRILPRQPEVSLPADRAAALSSCPSAKG